MAPVNPHYWTPDLGWRAPDGSLVAPIGKQLIPSPPVGTGPVPYIGSSPDGVPGITDTALFDQYQQWYNGMAITRLYSSSGIGAWTNGGPTGLFRHVVANSDTNMPIVYSWKDWDEAALRTFIASKPFNGRTIYLCWHHEPIPDWNSSISTYIARQRRMREIWVDEGSRSDIVLTMIHQSSQNSEYDAYWPGTWTYAGQTRRAVDVITFDLYNTGYANQKHTVVGDGQWMGRHYSWAESKVGVGNTGLTEFGAGVGPKWPGQSLDDRRRWLVGALEYGISRGVKMIIAWDRPSLKKWQSSGASEDTFGYAQHGAINRIDYRMALDAPLISEAPGTNAGNIAYGGPDPITKDMWRNYCEASRNAHNVTYTP